MKKNINTILRLLSDFQTSIEKRSPIFLVDKVLPNILDWKLIAWELYWVTFENKEKRNDFTEWFGLEQVLDTVIRKIGERSLESEPWLFSTLFLKHFQNHVQTHKEKQIVIKDARRYYIEDLFRLFYKLVFEKVASSSESYDFWMNFPQEWKVTKSNLLDEKNRIANISWYNFIDWARNRILTGQTFDRQLNDVSVNLFPELHPETWAMILIFVFSPYSPENRVKSVIERPWIFGYKIKPFTFFGEKKVEEVIQEQKMQEEIEIKNTYELTHLLFKEIFTKEQTEQYIKQANELKYPESSKEEYKRKKLLELFNGLLACTKCES